MGCAQASAVQTKPIPGPRGRGLTYEVGEVDVFAGDLPQARSLPRLLDSVAFQRGTAEELDNLSTASSRLTSITAVPTPSVVLSNLESLALSSNRAEIDKESFVEFPRSVGAASVCGTVFSQDEVESNLGSVDRLYAHMYIQELELAARQPVLMTAEAV
mmetsp:Transcript_12797/g.29026  ORF Transcript_12797/g.29026 Transcript_12797/m.29026 type:complete len:159 (-) Transcript_12797:181-657(-)